MRTIRVGTGYHDGCHAVVDRSSDNPVATLGELVDCWQEHRGDPAKKLVGQDTGKHLRDICKKHGIRSEEQS